MMRSSLWLIGFAIVAACGSDDSEPSRAGSGLSPSDSTTPGAEMTPSGQTPLETQPHLTDMTGLPSVTPVTAPPVATDGAQSASGDSPIGILGPGIHFVGRMTAPDPEGPRFAWSGSGVVAEFSGTGATLRLDDTGLNQFTVVIDGELSPKLATVSGPKDYALASGLTAGPHRIEVYRRTEASFGPTRFLGFDFGAAGTLLPPHPAAHRIEIIGDSVSAGYGNEGMVPCGFSADTENHYLTYGAIAARALNAELTTVAWSGKGIVYNYDTDAVDPMPALYGRILPQDPSSTYDFSTVPEVVVINLGTNDFSTDGDPTTELFGDEYSKLLKRVRTAYPYAFILCTVGPLLGGADLTAARAGIAAGVATFEAEGGSNVRAWEMNVLNGTPPGCDSHPNLSTHQAMADALISELEAYLD